MLFFNRLFQRVSGRSRRCCTRRRPTFSPLEIHAAQVETLEARALLSSTYVVDRGTDTGDGSGLRGDLSYCIANATSGSDIITFSPNLTGGIRLSETLYLSASVTIQGPGANLLTINEIPFLTGCTLQQFVFFDVASTAKVKISGLTIDGNDHVGWVGAFPTLGGISNHGTLTVNDCTFSNNSNAWGGGALSNDGTATVNACTFIQNCGAAGGAIFNSGTMTLNSSTIEGGNRNGNSDAASGGALFNQGALTINSSTIAHNTVQGGAVFDEDAVSSSSIPMGGGIYMSAGTLAINSSTLSENQAQAINANEYGGGLYIAGGTVSISNSTIADNQAIDGVNGSTGSGFGGGIYNAAGPGALQMYDTILADNSAKTANPDLEGNFISLGHNLIGNSAGGNGFVASDLVNVSPKLGPLMNNGGPTQTMALFAGSPALGAGDTTNATNFDQRGPGFVRIANGTIDIGAVETVKPMTILAKNLAITGFPASIMAGVSGTVTVAARKADGMIDMNFVGLVHFTSSDPQANLPADYTFTAADAGKHTFSVALKTAGIQSISATDTTFPAIAGNQTGISVKPAAASTLTVTGFPSPATAGVAGNFTVTARDPFGNVATSYLGKVSFTSIDSKAVLPANYTFTAADAGKHTFSATLKTSGTGTITATDTKTADIYGTEGSITVNAAAASKLVIIAPPASVTNSIAFSLIVTLQDAFGNFASGYTGKVHFTSTDKTSTLPADYTYIVAENGVHKFNALVLRKKGAQTLTITDTQNNHLTASVTLSVR